MNDARHGALPPIMDRPPACADDIICGDPHIHGDLVRLLAARDPKTMEVIRAAAETVLLREVGNVVHYRGLLEFSNECAMNCLYCGIRRDNGAVRRYTLGVEDILNAARWCAESGYGSIVLQSGERRDPAFVDFVETIVRAIKTATRSARLPGGLGITLCVGEHTPEAYERFYAAGAHRYLLRIETTDPGLFARIHPAGQTLERRMACLRSLRSIGYQVGSGVMIGLPGQTLDMLADDVLFLREFDMDMVGMGPYIVHAQTPWRRGRRPTAHRRKPCGWHC
jgi:biotin synthase